MDKQIITEFLIKAKQATYAGKGPESVSSRPNSHDYFYTEGNLTYIDTYLGGETFIGEECLWQGGIPLWAMNYCGRVIAAGFDGDFLKEVLCNASFEKPYRGPEKYSRGGLTYECSVQGDFAWFQGYETIYLHSQKVYECVFHGGKIK